VTDPELRRLTDDDAIRRLTASYSNAVARCDARRAASIYVEDGRVSIAGRETIGRLAIEEGMRQSFAAFSLLQMIAHGGLIRVDGDEADASWSTTELAIRRGSDTLDIIFGRYEDRLVRSAEGWRFARRVFTLAGRTQVDTIKSQINQDFFVAISSGGTPT
jgi:uncharacterized protein (TIGR02246 family)